MICCLIDKMLGTGERMLIKAQYDALKHLFDIQFTVIEDQVRLKIVKFRKS